MTGSTRFAFSLLAIFAAATAQAQTVPSQPQPEAQITVTARPEHPEKAARRFITQVLDTADGQLARFYDKVCLEVVGLPPAMRDKFASRFNLVASTVRAPLAGGKCTPNLIVLFVADTGSFMKLMQARHREFFYDLGDAQEAAALKPGSIRSWRQIQIMDDVGNGTTPDSKSENPVAFETPTHARTMNAVVVMDRPTITGKSLWQLADYAAMRALAGARPPEQGSIRADTILSLFDPAVSPSPTGLSDMDLVLLGGLYSMSPAASNGDAYSQASGIAARMTRPNKKK